MVKSSKSYPSDHYEVERIVDKKLIKGTPHYRVRWKGFSSSEDTWEPQRNLSNLTSMIKDFEAQRDKPAQKEKAERKKKEPAKKEVPPPPPPAQKKKTLPGSLEADEIDALKSFAKSSVSCEVAWKQRRTGMTPSSSEVPVVDLRYRCPQLLIDLLLAQLC